MIRISRTLPALVLLVAATTTACSRKRPPVVTPTPPAANDDDSARRDSIARAEAEARAAAERDRLAREAAERERAEREAAMLRTLEAKIFFDYDRSDLSADARATLDAKVEVLQANPAMRIRVAGHTDERGSDEYNLALGQRRAAAAKRYLTQRGIDASRIDVVSFGEEQGVCSESAESCWSQNRRDEFTVQR